MASISSRPNGHRWITFRAPTGRRQTIRLGLATEAQAMSFKTRIERLLVARRVGEVPDPETVEWLSKISDKFHDQLSRCGLCNPKGARTVGELVTWYLAVKSLKPSTMVNLRVAGNAMKRFFGNDRPLAYIAVDEAEDFRIWLRHSGAAKEKRELAPTTISCICRRARQMFTVAHKRGWMLVNPFGEMKNWVETNPSRDFYIPADVVHRIIENADPEIGLAMALARFAGMRCPSEVMAIQWSWVTWSTGLIEARSPKTERYPNHDRRLVPIFEDLRPYLERAWEAAPENAASVFGKAATITWAAIADRLEGACRRTGVVMWPKPWVNLRASCEHDWLRKHRIDEVAAWMGHSPTIALRHYSRVAAEMSARRASVVCGPSAAAGERNDKLTQRGIGEVGN